MVCGRLLWRGKSSGTTPWQSSNGKVMGLGMVLFPQKATHAYGRWFDCTPKRAPFLRPGTQLAVLCDQEKYILHCMRENSFVSESQTVTLKPSYRPPEVDERLPDEICGDLFGCLAFM